MACCFGSTSRQALRNEKRETVTLGVPTAPGAENTKAKSFAVAENVQSWQTSVAQPRECSSSQVRTADSEEIHSTGAAFSPSKLCKAPSAQSAACASDTYCSSNSHTLSALPSQQVQGATFFDDDDGDVDLVRHASGMCELPQQSCSGHVLCKDLPGASGQEA